MLSSVIIRCSMSAGIPVLDLRIIVIIVEGPGHPPGQLWVGACLDTARMHHEPESRA